MRSCSTPFSVPGRCLIPLVVALALDAHADTVVLKNGRTLEGLIARETTNGIALNVGVGQVHLKRSQIKSVTRSTPDQAKAMQAEWQDKYFSHRNFVPPRFKALASDLDSLRNQRGAAVASTRDILRLKAESTRLAEEINADQAKWIGIHQTIEKYPDKPVFSSRDELEIYNKTIALGNALQSGVILKQEKIAANAQLIERNNSGLTDYVRGLREFQARLAGEMAETPEEKSFLAHTEEQVGGFDRELHRVEVPYQADGSQAVMDVRVNDTQSGKFLLDTGASVVVLSQSFAQWLKLNVDTNQTVKMILANGQESQAHPVILQAVQSGEARAENVAAVVMDRPPAPGLDGLLGMSFLREFVLNFEPRTRRVELVKFAPAR
jgi:clan AA aspartic protease (TIGR02281 family)